MEKDIWATPEMILENIEWNFDPCPLNPSFNGLNIPWHGKVFCNPPYSEIPLWIQKAYNEMIHCEKITLLLPVWSSQIWFKKLIEECPSYIFKEKITFNGLYQNKGTATFRSILFFIK